MAMRDSGIRRAFECFADRYVPPTLTYASLTLLRGLVSEVDPAWLVALTMQV